MGSMEANVNTISLGLLLAPPKYILTFIGRARNYLNLLLNFCKVKSSRWLYHSPFSLLLSDENKLRYIIQEEHILKNESFREVSKVGKKMLSISEKASRNFIQDSPVCYVQALLPLNHS